MPSSRLMLSGSANPERRACARYDSPVGRDQRVDEAHRPAGLDDARLDLQPLADIRRCRIVDVEADSDGAPEWRPIVQRIFGNLPVGQAHGVVCKRSDHAAMDEAARIAVLSRNRTPICMAAGEVRE